MLSTVDSNQLLVEKARSMVPALRERGQVTDEIRRIPEDSITELKENELFKLLRPKMYGGLETNMRTFADVIVEISRGCASTGWILSLCNIRDLMISESFSEKTHQEIFNSTDDVVFAGVFRPRKCIVERVEGGYLIKEGNWMFCSGSLHATWGYFGMPLVDEHGNETDLGLITIPFDQLEIIDDWFTLGLRGTGSNSIKATDVFVPDHRVVSFTKTTQGHFESTHLRDIPLYNTALAPALHLSLGLPGLGIAQAALDTFLEKLPNRKIINHGVKNQKDAAITHLQVGEASLKIDTARMHFYRAADALDEWAQSGEFMDVDTRMRCAADIGYANQHCKEAIDILLETSGGSYVYDKDPFQRIFRDFSTMYVHRSISPTSFKENYGRLLSGVGLHPDALI